MDEVVFIGIAVAILVFVVVISPDNTVTEDRACQNTASNGAKTTKKPSGELIVGSIFGEIIRNITKDISVCKTKYERLEVQYLLLSEFQRFCKQKFPDPIIGMKIFLGAVTELGLVKEGLGSECINRHEVYIRCPRLNGPTGASVGTRLFALSHFIQKARGKTSGRDMTAVILGEKPLCPEDMDEFISPFESAELSLVVSLALIGFEGGVAGLQDFARSK